MWENVKIQVIEKIIEEIKSQDNWNLLKKHIAEEKIEEYIIYPLLKKFNIHIKKYVIIFITVHILIILLILLNIFISLYHKK